MRVFWALMILLFLTVLAAQVPMGIFSPIVAMIIATAKALLIVLFFMHVKYASKLTWLFASAAFMWLGILFVLGFIDYLSRGSIVPHPIGF